MAPDNLTKLDKYFREEVFPGTLTEVPEDYELHAVGFDFEEGCAPQFCLEYHETGADPTKSPYPVRWWANVGVADGLNAMLVILLS